MRLLEEFWYGNIEPTEYDTNACKEYKEVLHLCKCQRKSEPGAHEKVSHKRPRKSEPERSRIVDPVC